MTDVMGTPGMVARPEYPSAIMDPALAEFVALPEVTQRGLDEALGELEQRPWPDDARELVKGSVFAVLRCGVWIIYERDDEARTLEVWRLLP
ncbi:MAG: hypothetical protein Q7L55_05405 [Actinomycetota bacterium]|nr:hypothetical protein [Actinomycetota bacterium]